MFRDIELSREEMAGYKNISEERNEKLAVDLNVSILSASSWPTYPTVTVIIPPQIKQAIDKFEAHYKAKHSGRKLEFKHALAHCQLKAKFPKGSKELVVSSFQAIVLLLFNGLKQDEHMEYNYLKEATGLRKPLSHSLYISTKLTHPSPRRTKPHPPIPRLRQNPPLDQTPQIA
jgi:cullin-4